MTTINRAMSKTRKFSLSASIVTTAILAGCGGSTGTTSNFSADSVDTTTPVNDWVMVWNDEFDGTSIDSSKWSHEINCDGGGNQEQQCYTDSAENSFVADGMLNIVAKVAEEGAQKPYTSARMRTKDKGDWTYGRFEMRAKLPSGQGSWPAFWMLPTDEVYGGWPRSGEIDIIESVNLTAATSDGGTEANVYGTLHYGKEWPNNDHSGQAYLLPDNVNPADDFHTYAIEWQEGEIRWYVDDYLYATQIKSEVRYQSDGQAAGLIHKGWYTENYDIITGELETQWSNAPFDQDFHILLNFAVGGSWPENVNETGIDASAFANDQSFVVDYVRVYECAINPTTGAGCETVRGGYKDPEDALVEGAAPTPPPPETDGPVNDLVIFADDQNAAWPIWDCCAGSTPTVETDDAEHGAVAEFIIGATPTVMGFQTAEAENPIGFNASSMLDGGTVSFDMKVVTPPTDASAAWFFKIESNSASEAVDFQLTESAEGVAPVTGEWQTYTFSLQSLADAGLDLSNLDVLMVFPAWGAGEGAVYRVDNVVIGTGEGGGGSSAELVLFEDATNVDWPMWDCCAGSTPVEASDDAEHGITAEFAIGATPTVMGFITRSANGGSDMPFNASSILAEGVVQFDMKVTTAPNDAAAAWIFKIESTDGASAVEVDLTTSTEGLAPVAGVWQTYTFPLQTLFDAGLDLSAIDVVMIFPAWGAGEGAVYRVDNAKIYNPNATSGGSSAASSINLFQDTPATDWVIWDCCAGSTPTIETDDADHGATAEFVIGSSPTVMGIITKSANGGGDAPFNASSITATGSVSFDMKVVSAPNDSSAAWFFKIESNDQTEAVELPLTDSLEGTAPATGVWQTYTFPLQTLFDAGLDVSAIDVLMFFPAWGSGEGAVYRVDNISISAP